MLRQTFPVLVHGIHKKAINVENQTASKENIQRQNETLHPGMEIIATSWPKFALRSKEDGTTKERSSLILKLATSEMTNRVLQERLIEGHNLLTCEK